MTNIIITVLSDDIKKSKKFAKHLAGEGFFKIILDSNDELILNYEGTTIKAIKAHMGQRGHRHHKIYVDSESPRTIKLVDEMFRYKILPIYSPLCRFKLEVKNQIEYINFDKEISKYHEQMSKIEKW